MSESNDIQFVEYDEMTEKVIILFNDMKTGTRTEELSVWAYKQYLENPDDPSYTDRAKKIINALEKKGGMKWLEKTIKEFLRNQVLNNG